MSFHLNSAKWLELAAIVLKPKPQRRKPPKLGERPVDVWIRKYWKRKKAA